VLWLPVAFLMEFGFGQLFKVSQRRGYYAPLVVSCNYLVLAVGLGVYLMMTGGLSLSPMVIKVSLVTGTAFIGAMSLMTYALERVNVATVLTGFRMAMVVSIVASMGIWGETVSPAQAAGIVLALVALVLMTRRSSGPGRIHGFKALGLVLVVFLGQGCSLTCLRWVQYAGLNEQMHQVIMGTGLTAGLLGSLFLLLKRHRPTSGEVRMGGLIGLYNIMALLVILTTLAHVPGTLFFPAMGCTVVVLDNLCAHFFWKEPLDKITLVGVGVALVAILLVVGI
jgi:drug/metabolite transporter (DMT)-like permease